MLGALHAPVRALHPARVSTAAHATRCHRLLKERNSAQGYTGKTPPSPQNRTQGFPRVSALSVLTNKSSPAQPAGVPPWSQHQRVSKAPEDTIKAEDSLRLHLTWPWQSPLASPPPLGPSGPTCPPGALPLCPTSRCWPPPRFPRHHLIGQQASCILGPEP